MIDPLAQAAYMARMAELVEEHGWALQAVFGDSPIEAFTYTVGLTARGLPELWLGSLAPKQAGAVLNSLAEYAIETGAVSGTLDSWSVPFRIHGPVDFNESEAFVAEAFAGGRQPTVLQVMWPDDSGFWPDQDGYDHERFPQRVLPLAEVEAVVE